MAAILLFGLMAYRLLPVNDLPNVDFPTIQVTAALPGASPETMASAVATPLERQFTTIAGIDSMTSTSALGHHADHHPVHPRRATSTPPPRTCRRPSPRRRRCCRPACRRRRRTRRSIRPISRSSTSRSARHAAAVHGGRVRADEPRPAHLDDQRRRAGARVRLPEVRGARPGGPARPGRAGIGIDEVEQAIARGNVNKPTGTLYGPHQAFNVQATGQLMDAAAYRPLVVAYRNGVAGAPGGDRPRDRRRRRPTRWRAGSTTSAPSSSPSSASPGTNTVEVVDAIRALLPDLPPAAARRP